MRRYEAEHASVDRHRRTRCSSPNIENFTNTLKSRRRRHPSSAPTRKPVKSYRRHVLCMVWRAPTGAPQSQGHRSRNAATCSRSPTNHPDGRRAQARRSAIARTRRAAPGTDHLSVGIAAVLLGLALSWLIGRSITGPLNGLAAAMTRSRTATPPRAFPRPAPATRSATWRAPSSYSATT